MKRAHVFACCDIVTSKSFTIAKDGTSGIAVANRRPHDRSNFGKVLVYFEGRKHGYWVNPSDVLFPIDVQAERDGFIAQPPPTDKKRILPIVNSQLKYNFGKNLQILRDARNMSQAELGKQMRKYGVRLAQSTVCYREGSPHSPSGRFVNAVSGALKVPAFILFLPLDNLQVFTEARQFIGNMSSSLEN